MVRQERKLSEYLRGKSGSAERWLQSHLDLILFVCVALGFLIRAIIANKNYLTPDEAFYYFFANQPSPAMAYKANLTNAHPPFLILLLYFWRFLGNSEFVLRLPCVLAGAVFPWVVFKWLDGVLGRSAGLFAFVLLEFSPTMIVLSAEARGYALLLFFMACALYFLERAFQENSPLLVCAFSFFLYLAITTEYSALWFTLAVGAYALLRIRSEQLAKKVIWIWAASQLGAFTIYAFFYFTHISKLRGGPMERFAINDWLHASYFDPGADRFLAFIVDRTLGVFQYTFSQYAIGITVFILFVVGIGFLLLKDGFRRSERAPRSREFAILLLLPFAIGSAAAIARLYPYGDTRHNVYLALFVAAGASVLPGRLPGKKLWPGLFAAISIVAIANQQAKAVEFIRPQDQARSLMEKAVKDIHQSITPQAPILVDYETKFLLHYYLCPTQMVPFGEAGKRSPELACGDYRLVSTVPLVWMFTTESLPTALETMANTSGLNPGDRVWVAHAGWGADLWAQLAAQFPELNKLPHRDYGANICLFQARVGEVRHASGATH